MFYLIDEHDECPLFWNKPALFISRFSLMSRGRPPPLARYGTVDSKSKFQQIGKVSVTRAERFKRVGLQAYS